MRAVWRRRIGFARIDNIISENYTAAMLMLAVFILGFVAYVGVGGTIDRKLYRKSERRLLGLGFENGFQILRIYKSCEPRVKK